MALFGLIIGALVIGIVGGALIDSQFNKGKADMVATTTTTTTTAPTDTSTATATLTATQSAQLTSDIQSTCVSSISKMGAGNFDAGLSALIASISAGGTDLLTTLGNDISSAMNKNGSTSFTANNKPESKCLESVTVSGYMETWTYRSSKGNYIKQHIHATFTFLYWIKDADGNCLPKTITGQVTDQTWIIGPGGNLVSSLPEDAILIKYVREPINKRDVLNTNCCKILQSISVL